MLGRVGVVAVGALHLAAGAASAVATTEATEIMRGKCMSMAACFVGCLVFVVGESVFL